MAKISESDIVSSGKPVRPAGHKDLFWYDPSKPIVIGEESEYRATGVRSITGSLSGSLLSGAQSPKGPGSAGVIAGVVESSDVPNLSDIEKIEYIKYFDPVTKVEKAKVVIKIRNSSKNKSNVVGVDARIYQPRGA
jgi:hypothetical protein